MISLTVFYFSRTINLVMLEKIKDLFNKMSQRHKEAKEIAAEEGIQFGWLPVGAEEVRKEETGSGILGLTTKARRKLTKKTPTDFSEIEFDEDGLATVSSGEKDYVVKRFEKEGGRIDSRALARDIQNYAENLEQTGVKTPDIDRLLVKKKGKDHYRIISEDELISRGKNAADILEEANEEKALDVFEEVLGEIYKSFSHPKAEELNDFEVYNGLDGRAANFVKDTEGGEYYYIDLFPPKTRDKKGEPKWMEVSASKRSDIRNFCRFDKRGLVQRLIIRSARKRPELEKDFFKRTEEFLKGKNENELLNEVKEGYPRIREGYSDYESLKDEYEDFFEEEAER